MTVVYVPVVPWECLKKLVGLHAFDLDIFTFGRNAQYIVRYKKIPRIHLKYKLLSTYNYESTIRIIK